MSHRKIKVEKTVQSIIKFRSSGFHAEYDSRDGDIIEVNESIPINLLDAYIAFLQNVKEELKDVSSNS